MTDEINILGISAFYHDSAAVLIKDGEIIAAVQQERFTRKKHSLGLLYSAFTYMLLLGVLIVMSQGSAMAPGIYPLF